MANGGCAPERLLSLCLETISSNVGRYESFEGLPEEFVLLLFEMVLEKGKLTPRVLQLFVDTQHDAVVDKITALKLRDPPALVRDSHGQWLHQKPGWW